MADLLLDDGAAVVAEGEAVGVALALDRQARPGVGGRRAGVPVAGARLELETAGAPGPAPLGDPLPVERQLDVQPLLRASPVPDVDPDLVSGAPGGAVAHDLELLAAAFHPELGVVGIDLAGLEHPRVGAPVDVPLATAFRAGVEGRRSEDVH